MYVCMHVYMYVSACMHICIYVYKNLPRNPIVKLTHPRRGDSQGQKTFLAFSADKQIFRPATFLKRDSNMAFFCEHSEIFQNTFYEEHLQGAASKIKDFTSKKPSLSVIFNFCFDLIKNNL